MRIGKGNSSEYIKSMTTLVSGSMVAQIISIVVSPITTRLFSADEMGVFTLVSSATSMFGAILSLRYDMAIIYEKEERNVFALVVLSAWITIILSAVCGIGYYLYFALFSRSAYSPILAAVFTFIQCVLFGIINILNSYNNRTKEYGVMSAANVYRSVGQNVGTVVAGLLHTGATGLVAAQTL